MRGLARELACALDVQYRDPAAIDVPVAEGVAYPAEIEDADGCLRFVARRVTGVDPTAPTPWWIRRRLLLAGIRSISLAVDVTNYVMLETGQPMHAFDTPSLKGRIVVRRAAQGEKLTTLDDVERALDPDDMVVADDSGPISLAGVMGGASTEVRPDSTDILLESAIWDPSSIVRAVRRHKLPSEASRRFERYVDPLLPPAALERAARLLREEADGSIQPGRTDVGTPPALPTRDDGDRPARPGRRRSLRARRDRAAAEPDRLRHRGRLGRRRHADRDRAAAELASGPGRARGPRGGGAAARGLRRHPGGAAGHEARAAGPPRAQRRRRTVGRALAEAGYVEVLPFPFVSPSIWDKLGLAPEDSRRRTVTLLNPLDADHGELATTLLPGMLDVLVRNVSRGARDVALFHIGQVVLPKGPRSPMPRLGVGARPSDAQLASLNAALPQQPTHVAVVLAGNRRRAGWWGPGEEAGWADAVRAAEVVAEASNASLTVRAGELPPWHPGRCAQLLVDDLPVGYAGELHPKVVEALGLPKRTCAMELKLDGLPLAERRPALAPSPYPPVLLDVALVVDDTVPAANVAAALRGGGGDLLEDLNLFDVFTGKQVGEGKRSLAYALRFRAPDRTLTIEEATAARDAAVTAAGDRYGAVLRA